MFSRGFSTLRDRDRLAIALGVIAILAILFISRGLPKTQRWRRETVESGLELSRSMRSAEAMVQNEASAHDSLRARSAYLARLGPVYVTGSSSAALAAAMERAVDRAASRAALALGASRIAVDSLGAAEFVGVSMHVQATGDLHHLIAFIAEVEGGRPMLVVRELSLTRQSAPGDPESILADVLIQGLAHVSDHSVTAGRP